MNKSKKGISLIVLVITIVVVIILTAAVLLTLSQGGLTDSAKKARFMNDFRGIEEGVDIYSLSKINISNPNNYVLPIEGKLSLADKQEIVNKVPTLKTKIEELNPGRTIDDIDLYWISEPDIGANNIPSNKADKGYIIDAETRQIYDYYGDVFEGKRWHTLDGGVVESANGIGDVIEMWDGWIKLTLYYPPGSTARQWRLGTEGEVRLDPMLMWQDYTGPITIPLDRVKDVWIKYKLNNKDVIIPPAGTLLVDIEPDKTGYSKVDKVNVKINFDEEATTKEYRISDSGWIKYTGPFSVTENCFIEARASKKESIYDTDGNLVMTRDIAGRDIVYIGNIGVEEIDLPAPTITRLDAQTDVEKARVQVVYPPEALRKIYKINYGLEENYTSEIGINAWGTHVIAYYYDAAGKRSKSTSIVINDTSLGQPPQPPTPYPPDPPIDPGFPPPPLPPSYIIEAPTISVNPTTLVEEVQVSVNTPADADKIYIKLGRYGTYQPYTIPVTVRDNMEVYAYYKTYAGETSNVGYGLVSNIKKNNKPYVRINANPYPWSGSYGATKVTVTIAYSDANTIEYSDDGIIYKPYTGSFEVTKNQRIYARGTNNYGVTEAYLDITNIGPLKPPIPETALAVSINVQPEPVLSTTRVAKAKVTIEYDEKAAEKYYSIGRYGTLQTYTGPFEVTSSCTIYAYAKATNARGQSVKSIDNVSNGIADPIIITYPDSSTQASKVSVSITYDKYAKIKRYSIDGGALRDYAAPFEVTKNGSVIYAYSENDVGQKSEATYTIENIVPDPPTVLIDKGSYYLLKLNYPEGSKNREYKWKADGEWKSYKEAGILLIKPEFKNQLIQNGTLIKIEDETGNMVTFTGDYYFIDVPISELFENLFMRWDRVALTAPQIVINPTEPTRQVTATIIYTDAMVKRQYRVVKPGETLGEWKDYTGPITIDRNNTTIYAKGMDETEVWSNEAVSKVINIDENPPVISLTADLETASQKVGVKVNVTDDVGVGKVKWSPGIVGESFFSSGGTEIPNNSVVNVTQNGYYTFYAEDKVGNKQVYTLNVANVDLTPPSIDIQVNPENTVGLSANITIDYGDSTLKQYKVGTNNVAWLNYTNTFTITSNTVLANNWKNSDGTVTVYAKGKDSAGNEITVQRKILSLDLDRPMTPVINSNANYPVITSYGVVLDSTTTITYDTRTDIDNYYSLDNGVTWLKYNGSFEYPAGTIIAKSVKKDTGLEVTVSKTIAMPDDAIRPEGYDGSDTTYSTNTSNGVIKVDSSAEGKNLRVNLIFYTAEYGSGTIYFLNEANVEISRITLSSHYSVGYNTSVLIPAGTRTIKFSAITVRMNEIQLCNEPTLSATNGYMLIIDDPTKAIKEPYQLITLSYFPTSVQRLYRIGSTGNWLEYNDTPIWLKQGETIYAKGVDKDGHDTRITTTYTANVVDAVGKLAVDGNDSTYSDTASNAIIKLDPGVEGKNIRINLTFITAEYGSGTIYFLDANNAVISNITLSSHYSVGYNNIIKIPIGARTIKFTSNTVRVNEIQLCNEPTLSVTNGYMTITADITKAIKEPYQLINISYFPTSVQKLYKIGTSGDWLSYQNQPVWLKQGETIYAKGVDQYGNDTRVTTTYTANVIDAIGSLAADGNDSTYSDTLTSGIVKIDPSVEGKKIRINLMFYTAEYGSGTISYLDANNNVISNTVLSSHYNVGYNSIVQVPMGTRSIKFVANTVRIYEIQLCNEPTLSIANGYMLLSVDPAKAIKQPYQMVTINYFPTSVQRLYKIGSASDWVSYQDQPIWVNQGEVIYAKGVDRYGNDTRVTTTYTSSMPDAIGSLAVDGNTSTYSDTPNNAIIKLDPDTEGKKVKINLMFYTAEYGSGVIYFLDSNNSVISNISVSSHYNVAYNNTVQLPAGTRAIKFIANSIRVYEIGITT